MKDQKTMNTFNATVTLYLLFSCSLGFSENLDGRKESNQARNAARSLARLVANGGSPLLSNQFERQKLSPTLNKWISENEETIFGAGPSPFAKPIEWGVATTRGTKLFLHVMNWPEDGKLLIPRLHNSMVSVHLVGSDQQLKLTPDVADWQITLPEHRPKPKENILPVIEMQLDANAKIDVGSPPVVQPSKDGIIELHSRYAVVHGEMLRFEPQPHKNTVGYWVKENDWAEWGCQSPKAGKYTVELRYGCGSGQGGSEIEITVGNQVLPFTVEATGGFQNWKDVKLGSVDLPAAKTVKVTAKPKKKAKNAVMDIQQITLRAQ